MLAMVCMFVSPYNSHIDSITQCDGFRRWGVWKVIRSRGCGPYHGICALKRRDVRELASSPSVPEHVRIRWAVNQEHVPHQELDHAGTRISVFQPSELAQTFVV